ncbi:MAG: lactate utilization protein [Patescibacteria group bacterium]|nr:lactate utilization protein [Patescibacteria group bacterium]
MWNKLASKELVEETIKALKQRGMEAFFVETGNEANSKVLKLIPNGSKVLAATSRTLDSIGLSEELENSSEFKSIRKEYMVLDHEKDKERIRRLRATPDVVIGSIHAVTKDGRVLIASNTGSQLASYVYGANKVIWVVGVQKIVDNFDDALKRAYEYVLPLESERLKAVYGVPSNVSKLLIVDKEIEPERIKIIFVNEVLGF